MKEKVYKICKKCGKFKPCYPRRNKCCDCFIAEQKIRGIDYPSNPEYARAYYRAHKEKCCAYSQAYYARKRAEKVAETGVVIKRNLTKEQKAEKARNYYRDNAEKMRAYARRRRADLKKQKAVTMQIHEKKDILQIIVETGGKCGDFDCKKCPLNYREECKPADIVVEAERLLREKTIRD